MHFIKFIYYKLLLVFLWKSSRSFFQSGDNAPVTRAQTCFSEPEAGSDGCQAGIIMVRVKDQVKQYQHACGCVWQLVA